MTALARLAPALTLLPLAALADPVLECNGGMASEDEIAACIAETEARVDTAVEAALGFALATASDIDEMSGTDAAAALDAAQAAWTAYRDAQCGFIGALFGGGLDDGLAEAACRIDLGRARSAALIEAAR
jgi:uncharacterized protein YecT (DUF1311 family)